LVSGGCRRDAAVASLPEAVTKSKLVAVLNKVVLLLQAGKVLAVRNQQGGEVDDDKDDDETAMREELLAVAARRPAATADRRKSMMSADGLLRRLEGGRM
jgi:hypothetical protein